MENWSVYFRKCFHRDVNYNKAIGWCDPIQADNNIEMRIATFSSHDLKNSFWEEEPGKLSIYVTFGFDWLHPQQWSIYWNIIKLVSPRNKHFRLQKAYIFYVEYLCLFVRPSGCFWKSLQLLSRISILGP